MPAPYSIDPVVERLVRVFAVSATSLLTFVEISASLSHEPIEVILHGDRRIHVPDDL